jgi:hypothetical protein
MPRSIFVFSLIAMFLLMSFFSTSYARGGSQTALTGSYSGNEVHASKDSQNCLKGVIINQAVTPKARAFCIDKKNLPLTSDPQLGNKTYNSDGYYGISDSQYADKEFLTATPNIGIGEAFTDNYHNSTAGIWLHIGIGNNVGSLCTNPPEIWGEYLYYGASQYTELQLACGSYGSTYQLSIAYDTTGGSSCWVWWIGSTWYIELCGVGTAINLGGSLDFIEASGSTPYLSTSPDSSNIFTNALQYTSTRSTSHQFSSLTWNNPSSVVSYNGYQWVTKYWSDKVSGSSSKTITYEYNCGVQCPQIGE